MTNTNDFTFTGLTLYVKETESVFDQLIRFNAPIQALPFTGKPAAMPVSPSTVCSLLFAHKDAFANPFKLYPVNTPRDAKKALIQTTVIKGHKLRKITIPVFTTVPELSYKIMHAVKQFALETFGDDLVSVKAKKSEVSGDYNNASQFILVSTSRQTARRITVTQDNFDEVLETVLTGEIALNRYNPDCFGMSDLRLADAATALLSNLVDGLVETGNSPFLLVKPAFDRLGYNLEPAFDPNDFAHIENTTPFSFELIAGSVYGICESIREDAKVPVIQ